MLLARGKNGSRDCSAGRAGISRLMGAFDDSADPELGAACNRLATWVEPLPEGVVIDAASKLTERDLALILRHLHATRLGDYTGAPAETRTPRPIGRASVPITAKD